jgi:hypothetical protein
MDKQTNSQKRFTEALYVLCIQSTMGVILRPQSEWVKNCCTRWLTISFSSSSSTPVSLYEDVSDDSVEGVQWPLSTSGHLLAQWTNGRIAKIQTKCSKSRRFSSLPRFSDIVKQTCPASKSSGARFAWSHPAWLRRPKAED